MAISSQGSTFTFNGATYTATSVSVRSPQAEVTSMTSYGDAANAAVMVPTGGITAPGGVDVAAIGFLDPASSIGVAGPLVFGTQAGTITKRAVCMSATVEGKVGDCFRLNFSFVLTDYTGT